MPMRRCQRHTYACVLRRDNHLLFSANWVRFRKAIGTEDLASTAGSCVGELHTGMSWGMLQGCAVRFGRVLVQALACHVPVWHLGTGLR